MRFTARSTPPAILDGPAFDVPTLAAALSFLGSICSAISPVAIFATMMAAPITSAGRLWPCGPFGISTPAMLGGKQNRNGRPTRGDQDGEGQDVPAMWEIYFRASRQTAPLP